MTAIKVCENQNYSLLGEDILVTDVAVLSIGKKKKENDKKELLQHISILNGYLFNYYSSPIVKVLAFMNQEYQKEWETMARLILKKIIANCKCLGIQAERPELFAQVIFREEKD